MGEASEPVRVLVARPVPSPGCVDLGTLAALKRIGPDLRIEVAHDARSCVALARAGRVDVVVVERDLGSDALRILRELRSSGPPVVVVSAEARADVAVDAFREGAADCVSASEDYAEVLPTVVLEQIRAGRAARERARTRHRIEELESLRAAMVRAFPGGLAVVGRDGRIVTVNPGFARAFGLAAEAATGRRLQELLPADLLAEAELEALIEGALRGRPLPARVARTQAGGQLRAFDVRAERLDGTPRVLLVLTDVSERESLSTKLQELRSYAENIIQNMNSALLVVDLDGRITASNPAAECILGEEREGLRGRSVWSWFPSQDDEPHLIDQTLRFGRRFRGAETFVRRSDGARVPVGVSCAPLRDGSGERVGAIAIFQDLSEIKQLQRQVLQTEKMASIGQLAAGVAHEINNPMGFIHANLFQMAEYLADLERLWKAADRLREAVRGGPPEAWERAAERLEALVAELAPEELLRDFGQAIRESQEGSERIRHIVQDLRSFAHRDTGELVQADLNRCLESTAHIVWTMIKHSVKLRKRYGALPPVRCYPMQLQQVFMNLLLNAYQAIEERWARGQGEGGEIALETQAREGWAVVRVRDDGVGIAPEHLPRIFDPFFTTKRVGLGTGLGLSTSYEIVRRHRGSIRVESEPGRGACFEVVLPLDPDAAPGEPGEA